MKECAVKCRQSLKIKDSKIESLTCSEHHGHVRVCVLRSLQGLGLWSCGFLCECWGGGEFPVRGCGGSSLLSYRVPDRDKDLTN